MRPLQIAIAWLMLACPPMALGGHDDVQVNPAMKRYAGKITGLAAPDEKGGIYAFRAARMPEGSYPANELRGWRLTFLSGKRFGAVFEVHSNGVSEVAVTPLDGPLSDVAVNDYFVIEEIAVERPQK
jgi:hypothetical protein